MVMWRHLNKAREGAQRGSREKGDQYNAMRRGTDMTWTSGLMLQGELISVPPFGT